MKFRAHYSDDQHPNRHSILGLPLENSSGDSLVFTDFFGWLNGHLHTLFGREKRFDALTERGKSVTAISNKEGLNVVEHSYILSREAKGLPSERKSGESVMAQFHITPASIYPAFIVRFQQHFLILGWSFPQEVGRVTKSVGPFFRRESRFDCRVFHAPNIALSVRGVA